jgi:hypothetical protein
MNPQHYVLIDFENVQPKNLEPLRTTDHLIKVFLGNHQSKLATEFFELLLPFGQRVELIRIEGTGRNALDFHIAFNLGRLSCEEPGAAVQTERAMERFGAENPFNKSGTVDSA